MKQTSFQQLFALFDAKVQIPQQLIIYNGNNILPFANIPISGTHAFLLIIMVISLYQSIIESIFQEKHLRRYYKRQDFPFYRKLSRPVVLCSFCQSRLFTQHNTKYSAITPNLFLPHLVPTFTTNYNKRYTCTTPQPFYFTSTHLSQRPHLFQRNHQQPVP